MATVKSSQITDIDAAPSVKLQPNELGGRVREAVFYYESTSTTAVADVVQLTKLPKGARVLAIHINAEAMSSGAGTAGADFGDTGDADRFITALSLDAAVNGFQALRLDTAAREPTLGYHYKYAAETIVSATVTGEAWAANAGLRGTIYYVVD